MAQLKTNCLALGDCAENLVSRINHLDDMRTSVVSQVSNLIFWKLQPKLGTAISFVLCLSVHIRILGLEEGVRTE